jgi:hypothetical protein
MESRSVFSPYWISQSKKFHLGTYEILLQKRRGHIFLQMQMERNVRHNPLWEQKDILGGHLHNSLPEDMLSRTKG